MPIPYSRKLVPYAKKLRKDATPQENKLWYQYLKDYPIRFQRQKTVDSFIADFHCFRARLVIEIDGSQHFTPQGKAYDLDRSIILAQYHLQVIRFTNQQIDRHFSNVCRQIDAVVKSQLSVYDPGNKTK